MPVRFLLDGGYAAILWVHLGAVALLTLGMLPGMLRGLGRRGLAGLALVAAASAWLATVQPARPQVYFDEFFYTATAANLAAAGRAEPLIWQGLPPEAPRAERFLPPYPQGWPFLLSLAVPPGEPPRAGVQEDPPWERAVLVARILFACAPPLLYLALAHGVRGAGNLPVAAGAALALATLPPLLKLSGTAAAGTGSLAALVLALAALAEYHRRPGEVPLAWLVVCATLPGEMRPEGLFYVPLFLAAAWPRAHRPSRLKLWVALVVAAVLSLPPLVVMLSGALDPELAHHFAATPRLGLGPWENRLANLGNNALFFVTDRIWPLPLTLLALAGVATVREEEGRAPVLWCCAWILGITLALSWFPFGDYASVHSFDTWRFSHHVALPMLVLGSLGAAWLARTGRAGIAAAVVLGAWALLAPLLHREFLDAPHPMAATLEAAARVRAEAPSGWVAAEAPEVFCLLRYGLGLPAVLGPVRQVPPQGLWVFALEGPTGGLPDLRLWSPLDLDPVFVEPAAQGRAGLFRAVAPP